MYYNYAKLINRIKPNLTLSCAPYALEDPKLLYVWIIMSITDYMNDFSLALARILN